MISFLRRLLGPRPTPVDLITPEGLATAEAILTLRADGDVFRQLNEAKGLATKLPRIDYLRALYFIRLGDLSSAREAAKEELRYFPDSSEANALFMELGREATPASAPVGNDEFAEIYNVVREFTMLSPERLRSLYDRAMSVCATDLPGNFVECGVAAGGSSALLAAMIKRHSKSPRRLFSCDTFSGMPKPGRFDRHGGVDADATGWGTGTCSAPMESLRKAAELLGAFDVIEPVQGLFEETLPKERSRIGQIALLHMDGDWYSSTQAILENLFDQVATSAPIQIDDFGHWDGCRRAVNEFTGKRGLKWDLNQIDFTGVWLVK
jgi:Macrocin-O-methyltransferase (TylF)